MLPVLLIAILPIIYLIHEYFSDPLSRIPNAHPLSPYTTKWITHHRNRTTEVKAIYTAHRARGPIIRLSPTELSINSLEGLRAIYTQGAFEKHAFYADTFINFHTPNMVGMLENKAHGEQKRLLSGIYAKSYLLRSGDIKILGREMVVRRLGEFLKGVVAKGAVFNVLPVFQAVGMDFTSGFVFGAQGGTRFLEDLASWGVWLGQYEAFKSLSREDRFMGFVERWCLGLCEGVGLLKEDGGLVTQPVVYDRLWEGLEEKKKVSGEDINLKLAVASEILDHLVAGHETTGITITYIMWELSKRPDLQTRLREELATLSGSLRHTEEMEKKLPPLADIDALPLLDAIVRETLRRHAPAPAPLSRVTPPEGAWIHGYYIPGGVQVSSSAYSLHRIEEVFPSPEEWIPMRWMDAKDDKIHDMRRLFYPFGTGGRMCLGNNFAFLEIKLVIAMVYANYLPEVVDDEDIEQHLEFIALPKGRKLMVRFVPVEGNTV
ncbi:hypothetical protein ASPFODRAFT_43984 [Aspergillus luchuensis CBS 106.47]|uniref:Cytochrome P450 n=1 Tax=Aspergillus luchuensis (strain CBS 106.47) TaxID=1137211 RepID=A0A1M3TNH0_ASPLC|nr:hypothetical protein ASPFODRAFT_43984 [Aspergillus luchuensis CBS 106.47]BCS09734.1 hypothetical protein ALUC_30551S [Aspergillus luchuensis]GAA88441.1 cytochrome P450 monooxygenase [Aspergillus luchuensis IFO 4308]